MVPDLHNEPEIKAPGNPKTRGYPAQQRKEANGTRGYCGKLYRSVYPATEKVISTRLGKSGKIDKSDVTFPIG